MLFAKGLLSHFAKGQKRILPRFTRQEYASPETEFANRLKRLNLAIFVNVIMGIFLYLANPPEVLYGTMIYDRILIQKDGLQKRP